MSGNITGSQGSGPHRPAQQIARIATLLGELEQLSLDTPDVPFPLLSQTRASLEKARGVLKNYGSSAGRAPDDEGEGDPQPDIDNDLLERMYHHLRTGRRPPDR